jgi:hypothetical protein
MTKKAIQVWIDDKIRDRFRLKALQDKETMTSLIVKWIDQYLDGKNTD